VGDATRRVVASNGKGWVVALSNQRLTAMYRYHYELELECGHTRAYFSERSLNRTLPPAAPARVVCAECEASGGEAVR